MEVPAGVYVQTHYMPRRINGEGVGQYGVEGWIARYIYRDGRGFAQALQEAVLVAVDVIIKTNESADEFMPRICVSVLPGTSYGANLPFSTM